MSLFSTKSRGKKISGFQHITFMDQRKATFEDTPHLSAPNASNATGSNSNSKPKSRLPPKRINTVNVEDTSKAYSDVAGPFS